MKEQVCAVMGLGGPLAGARSSLHKAAIISSLVAVGLSLSAQAGVYPFTFSDSGSIPQGGGSPLSFEHTISGLPGHMEVVELILTFSSGSDLGRSINGTLILNPGSSGDTTTYVSFAPSATRAGAGGQEIYDVTFTGFNGYNPNGTWGLSLWDNNTSGNSLVSWSLEITAPEPVNVALGAFGLCVAGAGVGRRMYARVRTGC